MSTAIDRFEKKYPEEAKNLASKEEVRMMEEPTMDDFILYGIFHENKAFFPDYDVLLDANSWELKYYNDEFKESVLKLANEINEHWQKNEELPSDFYDVLIPNLAYTSTSRRDAMKNSLREMDEKYGVKK